MSVLEFILVPVCFLELIAIIGLVNDLAYANGRLRELVSEETTDDLEVPET